MTYRLGGGCSILLSYGGDVIRALDKTCRGDAKTTPLYTAASAKELGVAEHCPSKSTSYVSHYFAALTTDRADASLATAQPDVFQRLACFGWKLAGRCSRFVGPGSR